MGHKVKHTPRQAWKPMLLATLWARLDQAQRAQLSLLFSFSYQLQLETPLVWDTKRQVPCRNEEASLFLVTSLGGTLM